MDSAASQPKHLTLPQLPYPPFPDPPLSASEEYGASVTTADQHVLNCLNLLLWLANELKQYDIQAVQTSMPKYSHIDAALKSVQLVESFAKEMETALKRAATSCSESPSAVVKGKETATSAYIEPAVPPALVQPTISFPFPIEPIEPGPSSSFAPEIIPQQEGSAAQDDENVFTCYSEVKADPSDDTAINIKLMDRVRVDFRMEDGITAYGSNLNTGAMGSFPLSCIEVPPDVDTGDWPSRKDSKMSKQATVPDESPLPHHGTQRGYADAHLPPNHVVSPTFVYSPKTETPPLLTRNDQPLTTNLASPNRVQRPITMGSIPSVGSEPVARVNTVPYRPENMIHHLRQQIPETFLDIPGSSSFPARRESVRSSPRSDNSPPPLPPKHRPSVYGGAALPGMTPPAPAPTTPPEPPSAETMERRKAARQVIMELYDTEKNFMDSMQVMIDHFMQPLDECASSTADDSFITKLEHSTLFRNTRDLKNLSEKICGLLKAAVERVESEEDPAGAVAAVVNVFLVNVEYEEWTPYVRYMDGYLHAKQTLEKLQEREGFRTALKKCESAKECNRQGIGHFMILPVQRILRYHLLLGRLKKFADSNTEIHQSIETAEQYMKQIGDVLDSVQKQDEEFRQVFSVYEQIDGCPPDIISASRRRLLSSFEVDELFSGQHLHMHVFSDCFLLSTRRGDSASSSPHHSASSGSSGSKWKHRKDSDGKSKKGDKEKEYKFFARVELRDVEVQSVGNVKDGLAGFPELSPHLEMTGSGSGRVVVLRHVPGSGTLGRGRKPNGNLSPSSSLRESQDDRRSVDSGSSDFSSYSTTSSPVVSRRPSSCAPVSPMWFEGIPHLPHLSRKGTSKSAGSIMTNGSNRSSVDGSGPQELYAFRVPDSTRMAGLLAALGLAVVQRS